MAIITGPLASLKLTQIVAYDATLNDAAKRVFSLFAGYADKEGFCWPSINKMAQDLCLSRTAIIHQVNILMQHGYITRHCRYDPHSGKRTTNLYQLNYEFANLFVDNPEVFCQKNVTLVVTFLVTLFHYRAMKPLEVTSSVTQLGYTNITTSTEQANLNKNEHSEVKTRITSRKKNYASAWDEEKRREKVTGITSSHKKTIEFLTKDLKKYYNSAQIVQMDIEMRKHVKAMGMSPLAGIEYTIKRLQEEIAANAGKPAPDKTAKFPC